MQRLARIPLWVYLLVVATGLVAWGVAPNNVNPVNPEALEAMQSIVALCDQPRDAASPDAARCEDVHYFVEWCSNRGKGLCTADKVYESMLSLGFRLPPLHPPRD